MWHNGDILYRRQDAEEIDWQWSTTNQGAGQSALLKIAEKNSKTAKGELW